MKIKPHLIDELKIAELVSEDIIINNAEEAIDLLGNVYFQYFNSIIIHEKQITPVIFDLQNGIAGEILQKFSNYRVRLAIVGDFSKCKSKTVNAFIYESNKRGQINFVSTQSEAINILSK